MTFFTYKERRLSRVSKTPSGKKVMAFEDKSLQNILSSKSKTMTFIRLQVTFYQYKSTHTHTHTNYVCAAGKTGYRPTSFPGSSLFLPRESTLVSAGHVAPKIWVLTRMCYRGGVAKCKIVTSVRVVESTGGDVSFFRNISGDKNSFYRQVFLHYIRKFDIEAVHVIFDSEKHVYKSLNFKTLSRHSQRKPARVTT